MAIPPVCHRFLSKVVVLQRLYDSRRKKKKKPTTRIQGLAGYRLCV